MSTDYQLLGFIAAILTTASFVPQVVMVWRTNDTRSISLGMYSMMVTGIMLWLAYGLLIESPPLIFTNMLTGTLAGMVLFKKIKHTLANKDETQD